MIIRKLLFFLFLFLTFSTAKSNHLYGGEIQYKLIDTFNGIYEVQLVLNRSCKDYPLPITQFVDIKNCTGQIISIPLNLYKKEILPSACYQETCDGNQNVNIEKNYYKSNVLIGKKCGWTSIQYSGQNRAYSSNLNTIETPLFLQALVQTDYVNQSADFSFLSPSNPNLLELFKQKILVEDENNDSIFIEISAPFISEGNTLFNPQKADLKPTLTSQKPFFIFENQIFKSNNYISFTPSIPQNSWVNFIIYEYRKIERLNKNDTFVLVSKRNVDYFYMISNATSGIILHKMSSTQNAIHIDSQKIVYCNDFQSPQIEYSYLLPKNRLKDQVKFIGNNDLVLSEIKTIVSGNANYDTLKYILKLNPSFIDKKIDFQIEVSLCESNISKSKLFTYSFEWFQYKIFQKDTFLNCSASSEVIVPLLSNKNILFNYKKQNILKSDTLFNMRFLNPKDTMIYAQFSNTNSYCPIIDSMYLNQGDLIEDSIVKTSTSCFGYADAKAKIIVHKGNAPFQYLWLSTQSTSDSLTNLKKGNYSVLITDRDGCTKEEKIEILEPLGIQYTWVQDLPILCYGEASARGHFKINNSLKPYRYNWDHTALKDSFLTSMSSGIFSGNLEYINAMNNSCIQPFQISINQPDSVSFDYIKFDNLCYGESQGKIAISPKGGVGFYLYYIDDVPSIHSLKDNLSNQSYLVKVKDFNNCFSSSKLITISSPPKISTKYQIIKPSCSNSNNGSVQISETVGGYGAYEYRLNSNPYSNTPSYYKLASQDSLKISVRDAYGCKLDTTVLFDGAYQLKIASLKPDSLLCFDSKDGKALLEFQNGEIPYSINLQNQNYTLYAKKNILTNLERGTHTIEVIDKNGCKWDSLFTVFSPEKIRVKDSLVLPSCYGYSDAKLIAYIWGGNAPYSNFLWNNTSSLNTKDLLNIRAGNYVLTFNDRKNCLFKDTFTIPDAPVFKVKIQELSKSNCKNANDAVLGANIFGGKAPFTYIWNQNPNLTQPTLTQAQSSVYHFVQVLDSKGCIQNDSLFVSNPNGFDFSKISTKSPSCPERKNGFIDFSYKDTFVWLFSIDGGKNYKNVSVFNEVGKGTYRLFVKNQFQCIYDTLIEILPEKSIQISMPSILDTLMPGQEIALNPIFEYYKTQFSDISSFNWTPIDVLSCSNCPYPIVKPYKTDIYKLGIAYANECLSENMVKINVRKIEDLYIPNIFTPNQDNLNDCWQIYGFNIDKIEVQVYDKIGQKVFSSNRIDFCWDGTFKGQYCKNDLYLYKIEVLYKDGNSNEYKGQLTLLR